MTVRMSKPVALSASEPTDRKAGPEPRSIANRTPHAREDVVRSALGAFRIGSLAVKSVFVAAIVSGLNDAIRLGPRTEVFFEHEALHRRSHHRRGAGLGSPRRALALRELYRD